MDLTPDFSTNAPLSTSLTPVFGDNVQDLLNAGALQVNPSAIITVNSTNDAVDDFDSGVTTLRDAINQANADDGKDLIVFDRSVFSSPQTIGLNLGELDITHNLDIIAPRDSLTGSDLVTVSGNNATRVFEIRTNATVNLSGLIVADGKVTNDDGGGIKNSGNLTLDSSIVNNDSARNGGGIYNDNGANLTLSNSTISNNSASSNTNGVGGGIYNNNGASLTVSNSTISNNSAPSNANGAGGGIYNIGSTVTVNNSTLDGNSAGVFGGGIYGSVVLSNSTLNGNSAGVFGGGIYGSGAVSNSTISNNRTRSYGGGIYHDRDDTFAIGNSTITGNSSGFQGGGIYNATGTVALVFSTITQNLAPNGSGVYNGTVFEARYNGSSATSVRNTIIAANLLNENGVNPDVFGTFNSNGYNLIGDSTGSTGFGSPGDIVGTNDNPIDPRLAPLDFNGGSTQTIALLPDSPAIDAGDPTVLDTDPTTDQRGLDRVSNGRADIGSFEFSVSI